MESILNAIQAGTISTADLLVRLNDFNNESVDEFNELSEAYEANEEQCTQLAALLQETGDKLAMALDKCTSQARSIGQLETLGMQAAALANTKEAEAIAANGKAKQFKLYENENKAYKKNKAAQIKKATEREKRIVSLTADNRTLRTALQTAKSDVARLRLTGSKKVGKYTFTLFPSKVKCTEGGKETKQVALVIHDSKGCMKIITQSNESGEILQPKSHNFKLDGEVADYINDFMRVAKAANWQFTDEVLTAIN